MQNARAHIYMRTHQNVSPEAVTRTEHGVEKSPVPRIAVALPFHKLFVQCSLRG